jgi:hypothetical protein
MVRIRVRAMVRVRARARVRDDKGSIQRSVSIVRSINI